MFLDCSMTRAVVAEGPPISMTSGLVAIAAVIGEEKSVSV